WGPTWAFGPAACPYASDTIDFAREQSGQDRRGDGRGSPRHPRGASRHEVIDGTLVEKEAASGRHGAAQGRRVRRRAPYDRRPGGRSPGGWWFATEVEIWFEDTQVFRPDIAGWRRERLAEPPSEEPIMVRPDWVCEILSKYRRNDLIKKKRV